MIVGITARADCRRTECIEGPDGHDGKSEGKMECFGKLIGTNLARRIRRLALQRMIFIDRDVPRRAVNLARGRMDDAFDVRAARSLKNIESALDVRAHVGNRGWYEYGIPISAAR